MTILDLPDARTKMDPALKQRWITALTDGTYKQGQSYLQRDGQFCCLGVLCDLTAPEGWSESEHDEDSILHDGSLHFPNPDMASDWGLDNHYPVEDDSVLPIDLTEPTMMYYLAHKNDSGATFAKIAEIIEREL